MRSPARSLIHVLTAAALMTGSLVAVPGPASAAPTLQVVDAQQVHLVGDVTVHVTSSAAQVSWSLTTVSGGVIASGTAPTSSGAAVIDLDSTAPGYYGLTVTATSSGTTTATGSIAVLEPLAASQRGSDIGVGTHVFTSWKSAQLTAFQRVGYGKVRLTVPWEVVEKTKGVYAIPAEFDTALASFRASGARPLLVAAKNNILYANGNTPTTPTDLAAFAEYANTVLEHFGPTTTDLEIYNEYMYESNKGSCGITPACFQTMIDAVRERVLPAHPNAVLAATGVQAATTDTIDVSSVNAVITHQYTYPAAPESPSADKPSFDQRVTDWAQLIRSRPGGSSVGLWVDEFGWPTHTGPANMGPYTSEDQQADYLIRAQVQAFADGAQRTYWYDFVNDGYTDTVNEQNFGVMRLPRTGFTGLTPKPSLVAQATAIRQLAGLQYYARSATSPTTYAYRFGSGAVTTRVLWATVPAQVDVFTTQPLTVTDRFGAHTTLTPTGGKVRLSLDGHPVFARGSITSVVES